MRAGLLHLPPGDCRILFDDASDNLAEGHLCLYRFHMGDWRICWLHVRASAGGQEGTWCVPSVAVLRCDRLDDPHLLSLSGATFDVQ